MIPQSEIRNGGIMELKKLWIILGSAVLLLIAGAGGYYMGKSTEDEIYRKEKELNVQLNRSELDGMEKVEGTIYVTGHKSPDSDTVCSAILYASLLNQLGYEAKPAVLGPVNQETEYILQRAGVETPELLEDVSGLNIVLVDHSDYIQSAEGLQDAEIISVIDHHGAGNVTTGHQLIYDARPLGSTATIIWMRYRNYGIDVSPQEASLIIGAILSDTNHFLNNNTTFADREAVKQLSGLAGITDIDAYYQDMFKASISYHDMSDEEIFFSDYKEYESGGTKYGIGCINAYDDDDAREIAGRMKNIVTDSLAATGMDMAFAQISIFHDDLSITYLVPSNEAAAEVIRTAFGDDAVFDGTSFRIEPGISRRQVLVPAITDVLESYPKE